MVGSLATATYIGSPAQDRMRFSAADCQLKHGGRSGIRQLLAAVRCPVQRG
jgi:uncharacterized membrane protein